MARASTTPLAHVDATDVVITETNALIDRVNDIDAEGTVATPTSGVTVQDESVALTTQATTLNFTGSGVTASGTGATKTITIPGAAGGSGNKRGYYIAASNSPAYLKTLADVVCDGTADDVDINTVLKTATANYAATIATWVFLAPGTYDIQAPILVPAHCHLIGSGEGNGSIGTYLVLHAGSNCDVIRTQGVLQTGSTIQTYWHWGEIAYLCVDGNKANNTWGYGFHIGAMGEGASVHHCIAYNCPVDSVRVYGGTPNYIGDVYSYRAGRHGFVFSDFPEATLFRPSGDANGGSLIHVSGTGGGSIGVYGIKAERTTFTTAHDPLVLIDGFEGSVTIVAGNANGGQTANATDLVKRQGAGRNMRYALMIDGTSGNYTVTAGANTSGNIAAGASTATVQAAIEGITGIGAGQVTVTGVPNHYEVEFIGSKAATIVQMSATNVSLAGGVNNRPYTARMATAAAAISSAVDPKVHILGLGYLNYSNEYTDAINATWSQAGTTGSAQVANVIASPIGGKLIAVGGIGVGNSAAATTPGSVVRKMQVFDASGASLGFVPIYSSIS